ncbi:uncharacterized protein LOC118737727 [Rhagoletis pomonella]|uniref:uncharacterized protein LOC118737727 n=1 Tax=Rhagoletis pomonella TaxID=28610 RepID=UPI001781290F|nr:uncharacterized protein LOC118737727 [Rhagoletis pomonella]
MDRRKALALRNRRLQDQQRHAVDAQNQNGFIQKENRQNSISSPSSTLKEGNNATGMTLPKGDCTACRKQAICVCQRCGDYYCSPECQRKDWQSHRYICFPIPPLVFPTANLSPTMVHGGDQPLLTVNQMQLANVSVGNHTQTPNEMCNGNNFSQQHQMNSQYQQQQQYNFSQQHQMNSQYQQQQHNFSQQHQMNSQYQQQQHQMNSQYQQQQQQRLSQNINKASPQNTNKVQKHKEPTATLPKVELPKTNSHVILTGLRTPNRGYIRALTPAENDEYLSNARKIDSYGKNAPAMSKMPKTHSYAIAPCEGVMYRVEVLMVRNPENIRVLFIDRGIVASRRLSELREITDEIILLKQHTCLIPLRNVSNYVLNEKLVKRFCTYEDLEFKVKYDRVEDGVELLYWQTEKSLNDEIEQFCKNAGAEVWTDTTRSKSEQTGKKSRPVEKNTKVAEANAKDSKIQNSANRDENAGAEHDDQYYAVGGSAQNSTVNSQVSVRQQQPKPIEEAKKPQNVEKIVKTIEEVERPTMTPPFETHLFQVGCAPFTAIVLDVSWLEIGHVGCIAQTDLACLQTVQKQISSITISDKPYEPKLDEYCIAKFEDLWYRAQVTEIKGSVYTVMYIDFTNEADLTSADIRHYPADVTGVCKTNFCLIDGLPQTFSNELIKFLQNEIKLQSPIRIDGVNKIDEEVVFIECKSLLDNIRKNNLLT